MNPVASTFRRLNRRIERVNRRLATVDLPGKVIAGSQDYATRTLRLDLGRSADGRVIKGPMIGWQQPGAGTLKVHAPPKDDEQMRLRSPSGTVGTGSLADWSTYDDDNAPPSTSGEEAVLEFGGASRITMRSDEMVLKLGAASVTIRDSEIVAEIGATALTLKAGAATLVTPQYKVNP